MTDFQIRLDALDAAQRALPTGQPVYMLNLLKFRDQARYEGEAPPCTGREAFFERYVPAFRRLLGTLPAQRLFAGPVLAKLVAPAGANWDMALLNEYADFATFRRVVDTEAYRREAQPHRLAALADFRLFALGKVL